MISHILAGIVGGLIVIGLAFLIAAGVTRCPCKNRLNGQPCKCYPDI